MLYCCFKLYCLEGLVVFRREVRVCDFRLSHGGCFLAEEGAIQVRTFRGIRHVLFGGEVREDDVAGAVSTPVLQNP